MQCCTFGLVIHWLMFVFVRSIGTPSIITDAFSFVACDNLDLFTHFVSVFVLFISFAVYLQSLSRRLSQINPAFDPSRGENTSDACKRHARQFMSALHRLELWAFQSNYYAHEHHSPFPRGELIFLRKKND